MKSKKKKSSAQVYVRVIRLGLNLALWSHKHVETERKRFIGFWNNDISRKGLYKFSKSKKCTKNLPRYRSDLQNWSSSRYDGPKTCAHF